MIGLESGQNTSFDIFGSFLVIRLGPRERKLAAVEVGLGEGGRLCTFLILMYKIFARLLLKYGTSVYYSQLEKGSQLLKKFRNDCCGEFNDLKG